MSLELTLDMLAVAAYLVAIFGALPAFYTFIRKSRQQIKENESKIFNEIDADYNALSRLMLNFPSLSVSWFSEDDATKEFSNDELVQRAIIFDMITSHFEKTFLSYLDAHGRQRKSQWNGWRQYIEDYVSRPSYQKWWREATESSGDGTIQYDVRFERFINSLLTRLNNMQ